MTTLGGDAHGGGMDDEGAAAGVGADQFPLGLDLVGADVALVGGDTNLFIDTSEFAQLLDIAVHRVGIYDVTWDIVDGDSGAKLSSWIYRNFEVHSGHNDETATHRISSVDGEQR